jgi:hypothetical protein
VADVTPIIYADSITGATKLAYKAWAYRSTTLYYPAVGYSDPTAIVLGLADLFRRANYTPARKLNLHMTIDHIIPEDVVRTAPSDTFFKYVEALNIRLSGATKPHANERAGQNATLQNMWRAKATRWPAYPHCHVTGIGNYGDGGSWNFSTYADTSTIRQRWNFLERAISDTLQFFPAQGYDRTIGFPGDGVHFPHLYIFAQNRYTDIRAGASDSIGRSSSLHARRKVASRPLTAVNGLGNYMRPYLYIEPVSGRPIWIHDLDSFPGGSDTTWAQVSFLGGNDITGKCLKLASWTKPLVWDQDVYWHANENLEGPDDIMAVFMRRFTYFYGRTRNIITVEPSYRPLIPRRGGTPRS